MIESALEIIDLFDNPNKYTYLSSPDRYIIDSCINLAKWHILFEAATKLDYLNVRRSFYIYKTDEYPAIPIINIYTENAKTDVDSSSSFWKFTVTSGDVGLVKDVEVAGKPKNLESAVFHVEYVDSLTNPVPGWYSTVISDYKQLESTIQEAYVKVLELETM